MLMINQKDSSPIFQQLKRQIIEFIALGVYTPNEQLPSVRALANKLGINPNTVSRAYNELELEGYIYSIAGKGCFISEKDLSDEIIHDKLDVLRECIKECMKYDIDMDCVIDVVMDVYRKV